MLDWPALFTALGLVLIVEGLLPFISPDKARKAYFTAAQLPGEKLRLFGLASIIIGLVILWFIR